MFVHNLIFGVGLTLFMNAVGGFASPSASSKVISKSNPLIRYHGRWDATQSTWWAGTGFKLYVKNLKSISLNLGNLTTSPYVAAGLSVDYANFTSLNLTAGINAITLPQPIAKSTVLRFNVEGWVSNRLQLESILINEDAELQPYTQSSVKFQFIGDSLTSGQYDPNGVDDSWGFVVAETLKAEYQINAMPGGCLTDQNCWGNVRGVSHQFFQTQDVQYYYDAAQNRSGAFR
ncbi:hypothetical protein DL93DRAFT_2162987 [Clavulina sp. PMI_390]|nr:hypothetical protein DL93DRAFT_2162987 [Clavulina sp. PMI_390]